MAQLPLEPNRHTGQGVTGAFEGWFRNPDGTFTMLVGYFNRNLSEVVHIPTGPTNRFEPGPSDLGQPEYFLPQRQWGVFSFTVPKNFTGKLAWTLTVNGKTASIPLSLHPLWELDPFVDASGNKPPYVALSETGPWVNGPVGQYASLTAAVNQPLKLQLWAADDANLPPGATRLPTPPVTISWSLFRGPAPVHFSEVHPPVQKTQLQLPAKTGFGGVTETMAAFSAPGQYVLRAVANDWSGDGGRGFQCCWTNARIGITVK